VSPAGVHGYGRFGRPGSPRGAARRRGRGGRRRDGVRPGSPSADVEREWTMRHVAIGGRRGLVLAALAVALAACVPVTVNINFPQEKLDAAAGQIVDMGRKGPGAADSPPAGPGSPPPAAAQSREVEVAQKPRTDTEELRRLTAAQNARHGAIQQWKAKGCIGENNQGFLEARPGQGCGGEVGRLIAEENRGREAIIDTFMRQNSIPPSDAARVRASFAKAYRDRAQSGEWVQNDRGQWE